MTPYVKGYPLFTVIPFLAHLKVYPLIWTEYLEWAATALRNTVASAHFNHSAATCIKALRCRRPDRRPDTGGRVKPIAASCYLRR